MRRAVDSLAAMQFNGRGEHVWSQARVLLESEHQRLAVGQVAVPFGICTEPSNVQAGGGACPFRFRCLGCGHFRSDPSYLPELRDYLDTLLRDRERIRAATELDDWARAEAMPSEAEITRLRQLIRRVEHDLDALDDNDRRQIEEAVRIVRRTRQTVHLGLPTTTLAGTRPELGRPTVTTQPTNPLIAARRNDSDRRRRKVLDALDRLRTDGDEITVSAVARTAGVDRSFLYRHHDLRSQILALADEPEPTRPAPAPAGGRSWPTSPTSAPTTNDSATRTPSSPSDCPKSSANRSSTTPASPEPTKSAPSGNASPNSNNNSSTAAKTSRTATTNSPPPAPPTAT